MIDLFGGYASRSWKSSGEYCNAEGSWLFTLTHNGPAMFKAKPGDAYHLLNRPIYGPTFGYGHDLVVSD